MEEILTLDIILKQNIFNRDLLKKVVSKEITPKDIVSGNGEINLII